MKPLRNQHATILPNDDQFIVPLDRCIFGYSKEGGKDHRLAIKCAEDPTMARFFSCKSGNKTQNKVYYCNCGEKLVVQTIGGKKVVVDKIKFHQCERQSFQQLFFHLKTFTLMFGTLQEIETFEKATFSKCDRNGYVKVSQRNWGYCDHADADKNSIVIVREEKKRENARKYVVQRSANSDRTTLYSCCHCQNSKPAELIVYHLPSGIDVTWAPPAELHSKSCKADTIDSLAKKLACDIPDHRDRDVLQVIPKSRWLLTCSSFGKKNGRIVIKNEDDDDTCYEYGIANLCKSKKVSYHCTVCKQCPYVVHRIPPKMPNQYQRDLEPRIVGSVAFHDSCHPKSYQEVIGNLQKFVEHEKENPKAKTDVSFTVETYTTKLFENVPVIDKSRCFFGYSRLGSKMSKIYVKSLKDPQMSRFYQLEKIMRCGDYSYRCPCKKAVMVFPNDGNHIIKGFDCDHSCNLFSTRECFFKLKRNLLVHGTSEEIKQCEEATVSVCSEPGFCKVDQRDWIYVESQMLDKYSKISVREENITNFGRYYVLETSTDNEQGHYYCLTCLQENKKTRLIVDNSPSQIQVVWRPPNAEHIDSCVARRLPGLCLGKFREIREMDTDRIVPKQDWFIGNSSATNRDDRLFIKHDLDKTQCHVYLRLTHENTISPKIVFRCLLKCGLCWACYGTGENQRMVASFARCKQCKTMPLSKIKQDLVKYGSKADMPQSDDIELRGLDQKVNIRNAPRIPDSRYAINVSRTMMYIRSKEDPTIGFKFVKPISKALNLKKRFILRCPTCPCVAFYWCAFCTRNQLIVKNNEDHGPLCKPEKIDQSFCSLSEIANSNQEIVGNSSEAPLCDAEMPVGQKLVKKAVRKRTSNMKKGKVNKKQLQVSLPEKATWRSKTCSNLKSNESFFEDADSCDSDDFSIDLEDLADQEKRVTRSSTKVVRSGTNGAPTNTEKDDLPVSGSEESGNDSNYEVSDVDETNDAPPESVLDHGHYPDQPERQQPNRALTESPETPLSVDNSTFAKDSTATQNNAPQLFSIFLPKYENASSIKNNRKRLFSSNVNGQSDDEGDREKPKMPKFEVKTESEPELQFFHQLIFPDFKEIKFASTQEKENEIEFLRPSNIWLNSCCDVFHVKSSNNSYKIWASLQEIDLTSPEFPGLGEIKHFKNGFSLVSYLLTGSEDNADAIKEQIKMYFFDNHSTLGVVESTDCAKMSNAEIKNVLFSKDMGSIHFKVLSTMIKCSVFVFNYVKNSRFSFVSEDSGVPTIVVGRNVDGYFIFVD